MNTIDFSEGSQQNFRAIRETLEGNSLAEGLQSLRSRVQANLENNLIADGLENLREMRDMKCMIQVNQPCQSKNSNVKFYLYTR